MAQTQSVYGTKQTDERKFVANGILQNLSIDHEIDRLSLERSTSCLKGISYTPIKSPYTRTRYVVGEVPVRNTMRSKL